MNSGRALLAPRLSQLSPLGGDRSAQKVTTGNCSSPSSRWCRAREQESGAADATGAGRLSPTTSACSDRKGDVHSVSPFFKPPSQRRRRRRRLVIGSEAASTRRHFRPGRPLADGSAHAEPAATLCPSPWPWAPLTFKTFWERDVRARPRPRVRPARGVAKALRARREEGL